MIIKRRHRKVPGLNTASIADISFTLLILFLVVTSMDEDKGLTRHLPPVNNEVQTPTEMLDRNVMRMEIAADNHLTINGEPADISQVRSQVMRFVDNPDNSPLLPEKHLIEIYGLGRCAVTDGHVIQIVADRDASYDTYFQVQNEIVAAYIQLRDRLARSRFHQSYATCSEEQRMALREYYPQRVAEEYTEGKGGES